LTLNVDIVIFRDLFRGGNMKKIGSIIEKIYGDWLRFQNDENRKKYEEHKGMFSASSAGTCFRKQHLKRQGLDEPPLDNRVMRLLRLGTIVHEDIQQSLTDYFKLNKETLEQKLYIEHKIQIPELNVVGHLDIALHDEKADSVQVYDIKTSAAYKWKMKFGRNREKNGSINYNLQIGTYAFAIGEELQTTDINMSLLWYNKDNSQFREEVLDSEWIGNAIEYWEEVNETLEGVTSENGEELIPGSYGVPMMNWECRYCGFRDIYCQGV
tara:strand:- start:2706 stop:3509 length:804 start_codon:yes stop_codon:yes gene_type:complete